MIESIMAMFPLVLAALATVPMQSPSPISTATAIPLSAVRLLPGPFFEAMEADHRYLLTLEPHRLLHRFYVNAGLPTKGEMYGGWERDTISGHSTGHYLSACAQMFASTGDTRLLEKIDLLLGELQRCQAQREDGLVSGVPEIVRVFEEIRKGDIRSKGFDLNGLWVPWYTQHKLMAGLLDVHRWCERPEALAIARKLGDWAMEVTRDLKPEQWQTMLACEHGGIAESLAELSSRTGEKKYLDLALKFHHDAVLGPLERGEPKLAGLHGNTQIPKVIGEARLFELTQEPKQRNAAEFFWRQVVHDHTYAIGGHGFGEYFGPPGKLSDRLGPNTCETCNTYNMLKLTEHLFAWSPSVEEGDFYERALWNHILASQDHESGMTCYFVPLQPGARKTFSSPHNSFTCCHGTGMENPARYGAGLYFEAGDTLIVSQFVSSRIEWKAKGVALRLEASVPPTSIALHVESDQPKSFALKIRCPGWGSGPAIARVGTQIVGMGEPGTFLTVERTWRPGEELRLEIPATIRVEPMPDNPQRVALLYGPLVLAGVWPSPSGPDAKTPVLLPSESDPNAWLTRESQQDLAFKSKGSVRPVDLRFIPFFAVQDERYSVYWDVFDEAKWAEREEQYREDERRRAELEARTVDWLALGEMQPERDHGLEGEKTSVGDFGGRKWRHAWDEGWFAFTMRVDGAVSNTLVLTYWGGDGGNREFDILVDGKVLATQKLEQPAPGKFVDMEYAIPQGLTEGKEKCVIRIQARKRTTAGGVFGARVVRGRA